MIKPDTIDGVPEEGGNYLSRSYKNCDWEPTRVYNDPFTDDLIAEVTNGLKFREEYFDNRDWSERIAEPKSIDVE